MTPSCRRTGRRLAYARHLTSGRHPLVARVLVNRFWLHHFGRGLVGTPADFGALGERPTHPELLDWLADEFMRGGWTLKRLHRMIVTSTAYRQSSRRDRGPRRRRSREPPARPDAGPAARGRGGSRRDPRGQRAGSTRGCSVLRSRSPPTRRGW